jgi:pyruvate,water dikinase
MTVAGPMGTREVDVPRFLRGQPSLTADQAIDMAALAMRLEATMGWPVDVECAYAGGQLFLLQCRPITTLGGFAR